MAKPARRPQHQIGHVSTPTYRWRVLVAVPPIGFGTQLWVMRAWLDETCGRESWASAPAGTEGIVNNAVAFYFADPCCARAFVGRFCCGYRALPALAL
jgi:hypothetical protein